MPVLLPSRTAVAADEEPCAAQHACPMMDSVGLSVQQLREAECHLSAVLAHARDSVLRCEQALALLADIQRHATPQKPRAIHPDLAAAVAPLARNTNGIEHAVCLRPAAPLPQPLSVRESQILQHIAAGNSNREIAEALYLSLRTVERHIANIYLKLDAHNRADAIAYAVRERRA